MDLEVTGSILKYTMIIRYVTVWREWSEVDWVMGPSGPVYGREIFPGSIDNGRAIWKCTERNRIPNMGETGDIETNNRHGRVECGSDSVFSLGVVD